MNILYVKKKVMRMRLESQSISGSMEIGQPAVLPVEEVIPHFLFLSVCLHYWQISSLSKADSILKEVNSLSCI